MGSSSQNALGPAGFMAGMTSWLQRWGAAGPMPTARSHVLQADAFSVNCGLSVLVADDNPSHLRTASDLLERCGISALLVSDGAEAVRLACEKRFDIILMDLQMPIMDGLKATSRIRQFESTCSRPRTPVVAYSSAEVPTALLAASGMDDRIGKPSSTAELEACLLRWCDGFQPWSGSRSVSGA